MVPKLALPKSTNTNSKSITTWRNPAQQVKDIYGAFRQYFRHPACPPSFALALLYLTVLSFGGQMVTYLVAAGFNSFYIGLTRSLSVVVELSATWIAPRVMSRISPTRAAMWFLNWQILWLAATISFFWTEPNAIIAASGLCAGTILSRVGLWGYDLSAQVIIQIVSTFCLRVCDINSSPTSRRYRKTLEDPFRQRRPHFRMHSSFYPMLSPSRCLARTSSSIPPS